MDTCCPDMWKCSHDLAGVLSYLQTPDLGPYQKFEKRWEEALSLTGRRQELTLWTLMVVPPQSPAQNDHF